MSNKLYVGNLQWGVTNQELNDLFSEAGRVMDAVVILNRDTGRSRGFGFVEMETEEDIEAAIRELDKKEFKGRFLSVREAKPEGDKPEKVEEEESEFIQSIKDFEKTANVDESMGFLLANGKHFTVTRDEDDPPGAELNPVA